MTEQEPNAGPTPEDVQHGMQATRDHLGAGVEALGTRAVGYARDAAEAVEGVMYGVQQATLDVHHARVHKNGFFPSGAIRPVQTLTPPWSGWAELNL